MTETSLCPSVKRVNCDETKETFAHIFTLYERSIILVLRQEAGLVGDDTFYLKSWAKLTPSLQKRRFSFHLYPLVAL